MPCLFSLRCVGALLAFLFAPFTVHADLKWKDLP